DIQALDQLVSDGIVTLFQSSLTLIATIIIMLVIDVKYALVCFAIVPFVLVASLVFRIVSADIYRTTRERISLVTAYLQETISGVMVVRSYGQEDRHVNELVELSEANRDANMRSVMLNAAYFPAVELLNAVGLAVVLLYGGYLTISGDIQVGMVVTFAGLVGSFFDPIQQLSQLYATYQSGMAALDKIFELLSEAPDMADKPDAITLGTIRGEVELRDVWFSYGQDDPAKTHPDPEDIPLPDVTYALRGVDLKVAPGETIALVGATGAGKSTLAKLVTRFHDPQRGAVLVDGHDLRDVDSKLFRAQIGYVPQEGYLFSGTVASNIAFGKPDATREEIEAVARTVGAYEAISALPDGFDTDVGERGGHLSAGQRQLVAFARALITDPRLLILDEATASVDVQTESRIEDGLRRLLANRSALVIAHRLSTIKRASRIAVIEQGEVIELGPHDELIAAGGRYASLYATWEASTGADIA
ncbi:MAG: ABC transporter ATP-binding protein, partial [Thermoleophilaceae bacterium]|nr:ABC transporter ATP-binding protein [Thermoleophilaceae bacterium]